MKKLLFFTLVIPFLVSAQSQDQNYVQTKTYRIATDSTIAGPSVDQAQTDVTYYDGLGRPIQKIAYKQGANGNNIVTPMEYDGFGRKTRDYLPYTEGITLNFLPSATGNSATYYSSGNLSSTGNPNFDTTSNAYSEKLFEDSPLSRVLKQAAAGDDWVMGNGHEVVSDYQANGADEVRKFNVVTNIAGRIYNTNLISNGFYSPGELYKTITRDENWDIIVGPDNHTTHEFKDKEGRLILRRIFDYDVPHDTYYIYDIYGNLSYVIPPLVDTSATITTQVLNGLCYQYKYDDRNRLAEKKLPGKAWEYILYDSLDRPVVTGPVLSPFGSSEMGWLYTKYDAFGRVCYTGWFKQTTLQGDGDISAEVNSMRTFYSDFAHVFSAVRSITNTEVIANVTAGYRVGHVPSGLELLTINYYDNYTFPGGPTPPSTVLGQTVLVNAKGLQTGTWTRTLYADPAVEKKEIAYTLYDKKSRPTLTHTSQNTSGYHQLQTRYAFDGLVQLTKTLHKFNSSATLVTVIDSLDYTPQGRQLGHFHKINSKPWELLLHSSYDHLGNLISKEVGGQDLSTFEGLQKVDYRYNVRGWLTRINDTADLDNGNGENDLFAFGINYNQPTSQDYTVLPLFNGNISEAYWRSGSDNILRTYGYDYDHLNRLVAATYQKPGLTTGIGNYDEYISYDKNGNIQSLARTGDLDDPGMNILIDELYYAYDPASPNQLKKVTDNTNEPKGFKDDSDGTDDTVNDYTYDSLGNMTADQNKQITLITYNHLNLPVEITFAGGNKIEYLYDATGSKLTKAVTDSTTVTTTRYLNGFHYKNNVLQFFPTAEGYVNYTSGPGIDQNLAYNYVYNYTDHLGNIRLSWSKDPASHALKILEENHYYPFGLKHTNYSSDIKKYLKEEMQPLGIKPVPVGGSVEYEYKFFGMEWQDELGLNVYDNTFTMFDPAIGRRNNIDPKADQSRGWSPYSYCYNNPIYFTDPDGMQATPPDWINWTGKNGQQHITYHEGITTLEQAKANGYTTATQVFKAGDGSSKKTGETVSFMERGKFSVDGVNTMDVADGGYTTQGGTYINKGQTGIEQLATGLQTGGDALSAIGVATTQPEIIGIGETVSKFGLGIEIGNNFITKGFNVDTLQDAAIKVGINYAFGKVADAGVSATRTVAGKEYVASGANKVSESIIQGTTMVGQKTTENIIQGN